MLIVEGAPTEKPEALTPDDALTRAQQYLADGMSPTDAAKRAARETGHKKGDVYKWLTERKETDGT